jgi:hypothetical protein
MELTLLEQSADWEWRKIQHFGEYLLTPSSDDDVTCNLTATIMQSATQLPSCISETTLNAILLPLKARQNVTGNRVLYFCLHKLTCNYFDVFVMEKTFPVVNLRFHNANLSYWPSITQSWFCPKPVRYMMPNVLVHQHSCSFSVTWKSLNLTGRVKHTAVVVPLPTDNLLMTGEWRWEMDTQIEISRRNDEIRS